MGFGGVALNKLRDADKDKREFSVHSLISSSDLNTLESNILFDYKLYDSKICTEDQTEAKGAMIKLDFSTGKNPK